MIKYVSHSKRVVDLALKFGWQVCFRYTNTRDIKHINERIGLIDIDWKNYSFYKHRKVVERFQPVATIAKDIFCHTEIDSVIGQAEVLKQNCDYVLIVPKSIRMAKELEIAFPNDYLFGYSVPTKYGKTEIPTKYFKREVHLLGGRPDVQRKLGNELNVKSIDCNRFTLDAAFGDYFDGEIFRPHPIGGYENCIIDSIKNINELWKDYKK
jgi:hypothetical protein